MKKHSIFFSVLIIFSLSISVFSAEELIFAVTLIRHGDRTPTHALKNSPHKWKIGVGELTSLGMNQHNKLGSKLRARYVDKYKLLKPLYENNSMYVRCTDFNRTIQSAESFLSGLYPLGLGPKMNNQDPALPAAYQPIPLRTLPVPQDKLLLAHDAYIDTFNKMCDKYVYTTKSWKDMNNKYSKKFPEWSKLFATDITKLSQLLSIGDNINVRIRNGVALPSDLDKNDAEELVWLADWIQAQQFKPKEVGDYFGSYFLQSLKENFDYSITKKQQYKYILYSGHDSSILPVMSALGVPLKMNPPYASHIDFELFKENDTFYVTVRFNNKPVVLPGEKGSKCEIKNFNKIVDNSVKEKERLIKVFK